MGMEFFRPSGPGADVLELEYISALHQTATPDIRRDGSIKDVDICAFLASRFRIYKTPEEIRSVIIKDLGGGDSEEDCIDLMELVAILLIPMLLRAADANEYDEEKSTTVGSKDLEGGLGPNERKTKRNES